MNNKEVPQPPEQLVTLEEKALTTFFGKEIVVPQPPAELFHTLEALNKLGISKIELHYLPQTVLKRNERLPGWKVKPVSWFWRQIEIGKIAEDSATLRKGWYLLDGRGKPNYQGGKQMYEDDYLGPLIQDLRETGKIHKYPHMPDNSRFGASPYEIEWIILPEFAKLIKTSGRVRNMREIEFNVWGNIFHPEWGQSNTWEWFADKFGDNYRLAGGDYKKGGLADVGRSWYMGHGGHMLVTIGFRPLVVFPPKA